jgi:hypothetical protein
MKKMLPKGTELMCPKCNQVMVKARYDIHPGVIHADQWEKVNAESYQGAPMRCPFDRTPYAINRSGMRGEVHTKDGWV